MSRWRQLVLVAVTALSVAMAPLSTALAYTYPGGGILGRGEFRGYFENNYATCGARVISTGLGYNGGNSYVAGYGMAQFVGQIQGYLFSGLDGQDRTGAAFIVLTMLGVQGTDPQIAGSHNKGVNLARSLFFTNWLPEVTYYNSIPGKIEWARVMSFPFDGTSTYLNSLYQGRKDCGGPQPPDTRNPNDDAFYVDNTPQTHPTIIFHNDDGTVYMLKRNCANPVGPFGALIPRPDYDMQLSGNSNGSPYNVIRNGTYSLQAVLHNAGPGTSDPGTLQVQQPVGVVNAPCGGTCSPAPGQNNLFPGYQTGAGFRPNSGIGGVAGPNWYWTTAPVPSGATTSGIIQFTVAPNAPLGVFQFCMYYTPGNLAGRIDGLAPNPPVCVQFKVVSARYPIVTGANSDSHAGGCTTAPVTPIAGSLQGHVPTAASPNQSYDEYVVSASQLVSAINNFKSNGPLAPVGGADTLRLGQGGGYASICRPDLLNKVANPYRNGGGTGYNTRPAGPYDITGWSGLYYIDGAATLYGRVDHKLTIVVNGGDVDIVSPGIHINSAAAFPAHEDPVAGIEGPASLGIIASGNILIHNAATQVDAYLFSDGTIDTCSEGQSSTTACQSNLIVNGFLMAHDIAFRRLGLHDVNGAPATEQVVLNPQIYLNPPKFFDTSVDDILLEGQGEKQPLF